MKSNQAKIVSASLILLCWFFATATVAWPQGTFTTFDAPGTGTGTLQGTVPLAINAVGDVAGVHLDGKFVWHGFVRTANGWIAEFDIPGAHQGPCQPCVPVGHLGTSPTGIDTAGDIAGVYEDTGLVNHGFVRATDGTITTFDIPYVGYQGTVPLTMNASMGDIITE